MGWSAAAAVVLAAGSYQASADTSRRTTNAADAERNKLAFELSKPPPVMPMANDPNVAKARRRSLSEQMARRGRASTILSQGLTGDDASAKLGG